jgi:hypothetical protein
MVLLLDFDGVLHPDAVFLNKERRPFLRSEGSLFMWCQPLIETIEIYHQSQLQIVLATSWVAAFGLEVARESLPKELQKRVVDATWQKNNYMETGISNHRWGTMPRYSQVIQYVKRKKLNQWLAIDNDHEAFPTEIEHHIVRCNSDTGLSDAKTLRSLRDKIIANLEINPTDPEIHRSRLKIKKK